MATFSWTKYSYRGLFEPLTEEAWRALRAGPDNQHEELIARIREERWQSFWKDHNLIVWAVGALAISIPCALPDTPLRPLFSLIIFVTFLTPFSLIASAFSHSSALSKQCADLRRAFSTATTFPNYRSYIRSFSATANEEDAEEAGTRGQPPPTTRKSTAETYARILGVSPNASIAEIRDRYRTMAALYHPDKVNHLGQKLKALAEEEMKAINEAYRYFIERHPS